MRFADEAEARTWVASFRDAQITTYSSPRRAQRRGQARQDRALRRRIGRPRRRIRLSRRWQLELFIIFLLRNLRRALLDRITTRPAPLDGEDEQSAPPTAMLTADHIPIADLSLTETEGVRAHGYRGPPLAPAFASFAGAAAA